MDFKINKAISMIVLVCIFIVTYYNANQGYIALISILILHFVSIVILLTNRDSVRIIFNNSISRLFLSLTIPILISLLNYYRFSDFADILRLYIKANYPILIYIIMYYFISKGVINREKIRIFILIIFVLSAFMTISESSSLASARGVLVQTNWTNVVGCCLPFIFIFEKKSQPFLILIAGIIITIGLKRTGFLAFVVILMIYLLGDNSRQINGVKRIVIFISSILLILLIVFIVRDFFPEYFNHIMFRMKNIGVDQGSGRLNIYNNAINYWLNRVPPIHRLIGYGYGGFGYIDGTVGSAHNDMLDFLYSYGLPSLIIIIILYIKLLKDILLEFRHRNALSLFRISLIMIFFIYSNISSSFYYYFYSSAIFIGLAYSEVLRKKPKTVTTENNFKIRNDL